MWIEKILIFISQCLSFSPIFTISDDRFFGKIDKSKFDKNKVRYSLLSVKFGVRSYYFITKKKGEKLKLVFSQNFYQLQKYPNITLIDNAYDAYEIQLQPLNETLKLVHKETLLYKISEVEKVSNKTFNKFLAYLALIVFIIPLFSDYFENIYKYREMYKIIFICFLTYQFLNIIFIFYSFIKIKSTDRIKFKSVRNSSEPLNNFILMLYYEWRTQTQETTMQVGLMKNIEKYIVAVVISCFLFFITYNVVNYFDEEIKTKAKNDILQETEAASDGNICLNRFIPITKELLQEKEPMLLLPVFCYEDFNISILKRGE